VLAKLGRHSRSPGSRIEVCKPTSTRIDTGSFRASGPALLRRGRVARDNDADEISATHLRAARSRVTMTSLGGFVRRMLGKSVDRLRARRLYILCWSEFSRRRLLPAVSPAAGHLTTPTVAGLPGLCENFRPTTSKSSPI